MIAFGCHHTGKKTAPIREDVEWLDVWIPDNNEHDMPRVLLIGNSITRAYYPQVEENLQGMAYTARLTTSKSLGDPAFIDEIELIMTHTHFDVVHFNNGLHGGGYTEQEYERAIPEMIVAIKQYSPEAKLVWASSTPIRRGEQMEEFDPHTERIKERNRIALEVIREYDIVYNDLFAIVEDHPEYYVSGDGVHLIEEGTTALAERVSEVLRGCLNFPEHN